jgi:hypothetical protein
MLQTLLLEVATRYGLDGSVFVTRQVHDTFCFSHPSKPALGPTQPPIQLVLVLFLGIKAAGS